MRWILGRHPEHAEWPVPTGKPSFPCRVAGVQGQHAPQLPASAPLACQHLSRAFRSRVNCPLVTGPGRASLADSCSSFFLEEKPSPGGVQAQGQSRGWTGRTPRRDPPSAHPGPRSSSLWAVGRSLGLGLGRPWATPQALPINIGLTHFCPGPSTWAPEAQSPSSQGKSGGCSWGVQGGGQEGPFPGLGGSSQ